MRILLLSTLALTTSVLAQTTVYSNAAPRATSTVIAGSDTGAPSLRYWGASATDGTSLFNFGGRGVSAAGTANTTYYNGLDAYNPTTGAWTNLSADGNPAAPGNRFRQAMAFDANGNRLVIFGGSSAPGLTSSDGWAFDLGTNTWSSIPNSNPGTTGPSDRYDAKMAFDPASGLVVLFGGDGPTSGAGDRLNDTWLLAGNTWIPTTPANAPSARSLFTMTSRSAPYNDVILVGGQDSAGVRQNDTWRWDGTASNWVQITPINATVPVTFGGGNDSVYDSVRQVVVIINGTGTGIAPSNLTGAGGWTSEYDCVTNEWRAYGADLTDQGADDPIIGNHQRFAVAFLNGKTYFWGGQNAPSVGDINLPFVKEYQASPLASAVSYGIGCNGSAGSALTLTADNEPWTGRTWSGTCSNLGTTTLALQIFGLSTASVPLATILPGFGQPGCLLLNSAESVTGPLLPAAGTAPISIALPNTPALAGQSLHAQVAEINLTLTGLWTSNGLTLTIGAL
tara:strand:- start:3174 stop:4700 length:1527 start_codon:yes stop_codon:yes gene_type:complete